MTSDQESIVKTLRAVFHHRTIDPSGDPLGFLLAAAEFASMAVRRIPGTDQYSINERDVRALEWAVKNFKDPAGLRESAKTVFCEWRDGNRVVSDEAMWRLRTALEPLAADEAAPLKGSGE